MSENRVHRLSPRIGDIKLARKKKDEAARIRTQWRARIAEREISILEALTQPTENERKYVRKITLISILREMEGWTRATARHALLQNGFHEGVRISDLSRSRRMMEDFESIMDSSFERWVPNINVPDGYPFFGKIDDVLAQVDVTDFMPKPVEIEEVDNTANETNIESDDISSVLDDLLGGLDDEEE